MGGNSLLAIQLISRLRDALLIELSLHRLLASPTIAELSFNIELLRWAAETESAFINTTEEEYEEGYL